MNTKLHCALNASHHLEHHFGHVLGSSDLLHGDSLRRNEPEDPESNQEPNESLAKLSLSQVKLGGQKTNDFLFLGGVGREGRCEGVHIDGRLVQDTLQVGTLVEAFLAVDAPISAAAHTAEGQVRVAHV